MLESVYAKENARWKWRNIFFVCVSMLFRVQMISRRKDGRWKQEGAVWQSWPGHHHLSPPPFSILFHQLTRQMAQPASVTQKAISVLPDLARADRVRERGEEEKRADRGIFQHGFFLVCFFFPLVNFCAACQNEPHCPVAGLAWSAAGQGGEIGVWGKKLAEPRCLGATSLATC